MNDPYALPLAAPRVPPPPTPRARHLVRTAATRVALGFVLTVVAAVTVPSLLGYQTFTVLSGSMEPALGVGDLVVVEKVPPARAEVGDVVTFRSPDGLPRLITHRVVARRLAGGAAFFTTRGDANTGSEGWSVPLRGTIGRATYRVPKLGYVTNRLGSRLGRFAFLVVPACLLALIELRRIWSAPEPADGA